MLRWPLLLLSLVPIAARTNDSVPSWNGCTFPITVKVTQDVPIGRRNCGAYVRGTLCATNLTNRAVIANVIIKSGRQFQVVDNLGEGGCELEYAGRKYSVGSCPWMPGFRDGQSDIFVVVKLPSRKQAKDACLKFSGGAG
jgi:hypothetical protein